MITFDIQEELEEKEDWKIQNDNDADWWIEVKGQELAEVRQYQMKLQAKINVYQEKLRKAKEEEKQIIENRDSRLAEYFNTIDEKQMKKTKTQLQYRLANGVLKKKFQGPTFERDNDKLVKWLKENGMTDYVKVQESPDWATLKQGVIVKGDVVVTDGGEIVEGVTVVERPPKFEVEV